MQLEKLGQAILFSALALTSSAALADGHRSSLLSYTCAGCHGFNGVSTGPATPSIAGMNDEGFIEAMKAYKTDERPSTIMGRIAKGYSDEEIEGMAKFFKAQKFVPAVQTADAKKAAAGKKLHDSYCEKCHEDGGTTDEDGTGVLAGQWMPYLDYAMTDFGDGSRPIGKKMKKKLNKMIKKHGKDSVDKVIHFYGSHK